MRTRIERARGRERAIEEEGSRFIAQKGEINFAELWASIDRPSNVISHYNDMFNRTVPLCLREGSCVY